MNSKVWAAVILGVAILGTVFYTAWVQAGAWERLAGISWKTAASYKYQVEAAGADLRVYEWRSPSTRKVCMAVFSERSGGIGVQCYDSDHFDPEK